MGRAELINKSCCPLSFFLLKCNSEYEKLPLFCLTYTSLKSLGYRLLHLKTTSFIFINLECNFGPIGRLKQMSENHIKSPIKPKMQR